MLVVGVNSGTSVDSIDVAICKVSDHEQNFTTQISEHIIPIPRLQLIAFGSIPWESHVRQRIFHLMRSQQLSAKDFCEMNVVIGEAFKSAIEKVLLDHDIDVKLIQVIGSHGQTIYHQVESNALRKDQGNSQSTTDLVCENISSSSYRMIKSTLQLGDPSCMARLGIPVISNFRVNDVALGGQGAPLTSLFDFLLLRHPTKWRAIQNIGGIGNVTFVPPLNFSIDTQDVSSLVVSFDTGPGNALIDDCVRIVTKGNSQMDLDGKMASSGIRNETLFNHLCEFYKPYFEMPYPKTSGRELFGHDQVQQFIEQIHPNEDYSMDPSMANSLVATFTDLTAYSITRAYSLVISNLKIQTNNFEVVVAGGGQHNPHLMKRLSEMLSQEFGESPNSIRILSHEQLDSSQALNSNAKEAMLFALLAYLHEQGRVANLPSVTGALRACMLGSKTPAL